MTRPFKRSTHPAIEEKCRKQHERHGRKNNKRQPDIKIAGFFIAQIGEKTIKIEISRADEVMAVVPISNNIITITKK